MKYAARRLKRKPQFQRCPECREEIGEFKHGYVRDKCRKKAEAPPRDIFSGAKNTPPGGIA